MRPLLGVLTVGVLAGEAGAAVLPPAGMLAAAALAAGVGWLARRRAPLAWATLALGAVALGAAAGARVLAPELPADHVARLALPLRTTVVGRLVVAPERRDRRTVLLLEMETVGRGVTARRASGLVRVGVRGKARRWRYGDRLRLDATLRAPRNFENPGRFDYVAHLGRRGVRVTAFVWDTATIVRLPSSRRGLRARLEAWRLRLARHIAAAVPGEAGAVLEALIVGDEGDIEAELRDAFGRAGVVHVLSISGLHVGLVAAAAFAAARLLLGRSERLLLHADVRRLAAVLSLVPVACYTALAGFGVATLRAALMVVAAVLVALAGRRADVLRTLAVAALVLALAWPGSPLEISFQLSFASVLAIVLGTRACEGRLPAAPRCRRLAAAALVSPCALVGTAPLTAFHFHQVSLAGLLANPLAVPIFGSAVVVPGLLGAFVEPLWPAAAGHCFQVAGLLLRPAIALVRALATPRWAAIDVPIPTLVELALAYALLAALVLARRGAGRWLLLVVLAGIAADAAWWAHERLGSRLRVTFLDVGQGDAAVVELPGGRVIVVDAGGFPGADFDTGAAVVAPFLLSRKILRLDAVVMTHAHPDHSGGIPYLLSHFRPRTLWWTGVPGTGIEWERLRRAVHASGTRPLLLDTGTPLRTPGAALAVLHPPPELGPVSLNDSSLTMRVGLGDVAALLTGDVEAGAEERLLRAPGRLASTVLKVPHHGSRTSSTPAFVAAVAPTLAVISVGADNRYRLPSREVEARYAAAGACVLRTDRCGAITAETTGTGLRVTSAHKGCACGAFRRLASARGEGRT